MIKYNGVYIPSIDAKDLYIANNYFNDSSNTGYSLYNKNGEYNLNKFINTLDFSLELIKLREIYQLVKRRKNDFGKMINGKEYCSRVINVTFKYSNKNWNQYGSNLYIRYGYNIRRCRMSDCLCFNGVGELIAIEVDKKVKTPIYINNKNFYYDESCNEYKKRGNFKIINSVANLRESIYKDGFYCDGVKYVRYKRSSGSSRVGRCLFIDETLYNKIHQWELCGLDIMENDPVDLAAFESYISLTLSSIINTIQIKRENILIIEDHKSVFKDDVVVTKVENKQLVTSYENAKIENDIWDGQSLLDVGHFSDYKNYGMMLLRNRFFKSACFNCNIQKWFADNGITQISQLNGFTLAEDIGQIKLITTPNSIKYLKFVDNNYTAWIDNLDDNFGIVKHEKPTYYFDGRMVQMHYQLLNSLELSFKEVQELIAPDLNYLNLLNNDIDVFRYHLKYQSEDYEIDEELKTQNEIIFKMIGLNEKFYHTKLCRDFLNNLTKSYKKNLRCGHLTINGTYTVLFGNPIEMLKASIGQFDGRSEFVPNTVYTTFYGDGEELVGSRSPHISFSNVLVKTNRYYENIDRYFNLSNEIICVNSINENILNQLSGADFDSDSILITNNSIILAAAKKNNGRFKIPLSLVGAKKIQRRYNSEQKTDLDIKTSVNLIGEIINFSQELNSLYWDRIATGYSHDDNMDIYLDICQLDIMSRLEIDMAKREFEISNKNELNLLKTKYQDSKNYKKPRFFSVLAKMKGFDTGKKEYRNYNTPMDYLQKCIDSHRISGTKHRKLEFYEILNYVPTGRHNDRQVAKIKKIINDCNYYIRNMWANRDDIDGYNKYILCMEKKQEMIDEINKIQMNKNTIYYILRSIEKNDFKRISQLILTVMFSYKNKEFYEILTDSIEVSNSKLTEIDNGLIDIFGFKYTKT